MRCSPDQTAWVRALAGDIVLCSWARHFTLLVPLSSQVYKWVQANLMSGVTPIQGGGGGSRNNMLLKPCHLACNADFSCCRASSTARSQRIMKAMKSLQHHKPRFSQWTWTLIATWRTHLNAAVVLLSAPVPSLNQFLN